VAVDCAAIPESLFESELFGHEKGSFTDATSQKIGKFELANGGTLFLDEIGNLHPDIQAKILRVLEEREIQRVGGNKVIRIDTRIISATNIDLKKAVKAGKFRQDLYYRLNVIPITVPPLRERKDDIPGLVNHFIAFYNKELGKNIEGISKEALNLMMSYSWPGNVRELRNVIERLVALSKETVISDKRLPLDILISSAEKTDDYFDKISLRDARAEFEKQFIMKILERANWNQTKAAQLLGIHRNALLYKIHSFNLRPLMNKARAHDASPQEA
jgi:transcriptional regulator with PAS, ATPase and Fis domain